jgi:hypothetical protein
MNELKTHLYSKNKNASIKWTMVEESIKVSPARLSGLLYSDSRRK